MKKKILLLIVTLLSLISISEAQSKQVVILPDSIAQLVIEDLALLDHLKYKVQLQDSIILAYQKSDENYKHIVANYKLSTEQYQLIISNMTKISEIQNAKLKDQQTRERKRKIRATIIDIGQTIVIIGLTYLLIQQ